MSDYSRNPIPEDSIEETRRKKMEEFRLVVWGLHGLYGAGKDMDEAFGLVETVEKAAQLYMISAHLPRINTITDDQLRVIAKAFGVKHREDFLE